LDEKSSVWRKEGREKMHRSMADSTNDAGVPSMDGAITVCPMYMYSAHLAQWLLT
jgi:hypothetical protein